MPLYGISKETGKKVLIPDSQTYFWQPVEWKERDLTKDAKKQNLSYEKRVQALERWVNETFNGKYKQQRLDIIEMHDKDQILEEYKERLKEDYPVRVPTSPNLRVGVEKELCPNLQKLGNKVAFASEFALYLTLKHRRNSIAGGDIDDMDFDNETPNKGYLSQFREVDQRIPTPAIEIGAATNRYKHIGVVNIPRITSVYGKEMRSLFGAGEGFVQYNFDFSSLEARIMGHYVMKYPKGEEMATMLLAEKPNDWHSVTARKLDISRGDCKSVNYGLIYGSQPKKVAKMLGVGIERGKEVYNEAWDAMPALRDLRDKLTEFWEKNGKKFIVTLDGRKVFARSKHSLLNYLFQSSGIVSAKYTMIFIYEILEQQGLCLDPFIGKPDFSSMIEMHDEMATAINPKFIEVRVFEDEDSAKDFVKNWKGEQLSGIGHTKNGKYFVALPNIVSKATNQAIEMVNEKFSIRVPLGVEWLVGRNWAECH